MIRLKLFKTLYNRNLKKNRLMVIFMLLTNFLLGSFVLFLDADKEVVTRLDQSYLEHLSVGISSYETLTTNNELINVRMHQRPPMDILTSMMTHIGYFEVRPDYGLLFDHAELMMFEKILNKPTIAIHALKTNAIGINRSFYDELIDAVQPLDSLIINLKIAFTLSLNATDLDININESLSISYIHDEAPFFLTPKLYLPQSMIDEKIGGYQLFEDVTINDYLLNLPNDHPSSGYQLLCHLESNAQKQRLISLVEDLSDDTYGYVLTGDTVSKLQSVKAMFFYVNLLVSIFLVLIVIGCIVVYVTIIHTSLLSSMRQMALLSIWGAKKGQLFALFISLVMFNFVMGLSVFLLFPPLITALNRFLSSFLRMPLIFGFKSFRIFILITSQFVIMTILYTVLFFVNNRKPLLYLLLDA
ncbi:MAG: hypothetical protein WC968_00330 [Bacilli bacterium]